MHLKALDRRSPVHQLSALVALLLVGHLGHISSLKHEKCSFEVSHLPERVWPTNYDLTIKPNLDTLSFKGEVNISIQVRENQRCSPGWFRLMKPKKSGPLDCDPTVLVLNYMNMMEILKVIYYGDARVKSVCTDVSERFLVIRFNETLAEGSTGNLYLRYKGPITRSGFSRSSYTDRKNRTKLGAYWKFPPNGAREVFPCFDEPKFKATFDITIRHQAHLTAISNTPSISRRRAEGKRNVFITKFKRTPRMSTNAVGLALGEFDSQEIKTRVHTIRVHTPPGRGDEAKQLLQYAAQAYSNMSQWFRYHDLMDKTDIVLFEDPDATNSYGGWGIITGSTDTFLNRDKASSREQLDDMLLISKIMFHNWLGNMASMKSWDDLWLLDAIGLYFSVDVSKSIPTNRGDLETLLLLTAVRPVLEVDLDDEHHEPVKRANTEESVEMEHARNWFTTSKAYAIIKMLAMYMGGTKFKEAIRTYIFLHQNMIGDDFDIYHVIERNYHVQVKSFMASWVEQAGHPIVMVQQVGREIRLTQKSGRMENPSHLWMIPMKILVGGGGDKQHIDVFMNDTNYSVQLPEWFDATNKNHWLLVNSDFMSLVNVVYKGDLLKRLKKPSTSGRELSTGDKLSIVDSMDMMYKFNHLSVMDLLESIRWFSKETDGAVIARLSDLNRYSQMKTYLTEVMFNHYKESGGFAGKPNETALAKIGRMDAIKCLIGNLNLDVMDDAMNWFKSFENPLMVLGHESQEIAIDVILRAGSLRQFMGLCKMFENSTNPRGYLRLIENQDYQGRRKICEKIIMRRPLI